MFLKDRTYELAQFYLNQRVLVCNFQHIFVLQFQKDVLNLQCYYNFVFLINGFLSKDSLFILCSAVGHWAQ